MFLSASARHLASIPWRTSAAFSEAVAVTSRTTLQNTGLAIAVLRVAVLPVLGWRLPSILPNLWDSILRAVPKKKTSHRKKRQRFLAGKALKDVTHLSRCPACGNIKRAHLLCPYCVREIKDIWQGRDVAGKRVEQKLDHEVDA